MHEQADRARTDHRHHVAGLHAAVLDDGLVRDAQGLGQGGCPKRDAFRDPMQNPRRHSHVLRKGAVDVEAETLPATAALVEIRAAKDALPAVIGVCFRRHPLADPATLDVFPQLDDRPGKLVPHDEGKLKIKLHEVMVHVRVGAADPHVSHLDQHFAGPGLWNRHVAQIRRAVPIRVFHHRLHGFHRCDLPCLQRNGRRSFRFTKTETVPVNG